MANIVSNTIDSVLERIPFWPDQFTDHRYLWAAGAVLAATAILDAKTDNVETERARQPVLADPESAAAVIGHMRKSSNLERGPMWRAAGIAMAGLVYISQPVDATTHSTGNITFAVDAGQQAEVKDMSGQTRLDASLKGAIDAVEGRHGMKATFLLSGDGTHEVAELPTAHGGNNIVVKRTDEWLRTHPSFRNGRAMGQAVEAADAKYSGENNRVIVLSANPGNAQYVPKIKAAAQDKNVYAVVTGSGNEKLEVAGLAIAADVDVNGFRSALGNEKVSTAKSAKEVEKQVDTIIDKELSQKTEEPAKAPNLIFAGLIAFNFYRGFKRRGATLRAVRGKK